MIDDIYLESEEKMEKTLENTRQQLSKVRTGKASPAILDSVRVNYYGTPTPLKQIASVTVPEMRLIVVQPWEKNIISDVEKAILKADLGLNPISDGNLIRLPVPPLSEERRVDLVKLTKRIGEEGKVAVRNVRRDANEIMKKSEKSHDIS
ncbi:ribosome recycling factor, partial [candidate division KSB1 bacterium]|nr:ribosome recycling factor [candidate division KSB1 bacterium]